MPLSCPRIPNNRSKTVPNDKPPKLALPVVKMQFRRFTFKHWQLIMQIFVPAAGFGLVHSKTSAQIFQKMPADHDSMPVEPH